MAWQTTLRRIFGLGERANAAPAVQEQLSIAAMGTSALTQEDWYWGPLPRGTEEDALWRRLSDNWFQRDNDPATFLEILNHCYEAYTANPLAFTIVETITNFTLGRGVRVAATNKRVQRVLDAFWHDADNHMETRIYALCTELSVYGEQFVRFFVNPIDGRVKVAQIDPSTIDEIVCDPENVEQPLRFHQRPVGPYPTPGRLEAGGTGGPAPAGRMPAVQNPAPAGRMPAVQNPAPAGRMPAVQNPAPAGWETGGTPLSETEGRWFEAGSEVVQFAINKVSNAKRGRSDLATLLPWLRRYKDWLTDRVRLNKYKTAFLWFACGLIAFRAAGLFG
jgi:hypothetical protein